MKKPSAFSEASPYKSVVEELERLRKTFRSLNQRYTARVETEIDALRESVLNAAEAAFDKASNGLAATGNRPATAAAKGKTTGRREPKLAAVEAAGEQQTEQFHDLRDMLTLLRTFEIDPGMVKRRDFKRVENMLEELQLLARRWA